ncbi:MAG: NAD-dependent epimerase/dehydratase family protein, partial [bacterium]
MIGIISSSGFIGKGIKKILTTKRIGNLGIFFTNSEGDISFEEFINSEYIEGIKILVICAGNSSYAIEDFEKALIRELKYLHHIYHSKFKGNIIFFSSASVYYGYYGIVKENNIIIPRNYYSFLKNLGENFITMMALNKNIKSIIFRLTYVFGLNKSKKRLFDIFLEGIKNNEMVYIDC